MSQTQNNNNNNNRQPTVEEVEQQKLAARNEQANKQQQAQASQGQGQGQNRTLDNQVAKSPQQQQSSPPTPQAGGDGNISTETGPNGVSKVILKTEYITMEITDPNILNELNTPDKYAQNLPFKGIEFNINKAGGRLVVRTEDKKEVIRDVSSGVNKKETEVMQTFQIERGSNPIPEGAQLADYPSQ